MKMHTPTRERGPMLQRNYWSTVVTALVASLALLLLQPSGAAAGSITFNDGTDSLTAVLSADILARPGNNSGGCSGEACSATINAPAGFSTTTGTVTTTGNVNIFGTDGPGGTRVLSDTIGFITLSASLAVAHFNFISDSNTGAAVTPVGVFQG